MNFPTDFRGRIVQVVEALDVGDAVSGQVIALDEMLREMGLNSQVLVKWMHHDVRGKCDVLDDVRLTDEDVVIYHSAGFSDHSLPYVLDTHCTRILLYHNITPHEFFEESSDLHVFCKNGREQLKSVIGAFQYFWADSQYNLDELIELGAPKERCHVIPIMVASPEQTGHSDKVPGSWLFLGRIAANKGQMDLAQEFLKARREDPKSASKLFLVGGYNDQEPYYCALKQLVERKGKGNIVLTGKVGDAQKEHFLHQSAVFVSFSRHEGFGVPLVEAPLRGTPVIALSGTAVDETMGGSSGVAGSAADARRLAMRAARDEAFREKLLIEQQSNAARFERSAVRSKLWNALEDVLPARDRYRKVSVVVCTYNRRADLERCLDYLAYQSSPSFEVVVVDGPSTDGTKELLAEWEGRVKIVHNPERNLSVSRNLGADAAAGDIVAYIDDDAIPFADWVDTLLREFNQRPATTAALGGPAYLAGSLKFQVEDIAFNKFAEAWANVDSDKIGKDGWVRSLLGTNTAFSRSYLQEVGGFDEQYDYFLDESDLTFRLQSHGALVAYCPDLYLRHEFARSDNRKGKYTFNWYSISKNTTYFIALYSGLGGEELLQYVKEKLAKERVAPLDAALAAGNINKKLHSQLVAEIWRGMKQGLKDSERGVMTRQISPPPTNFLPFESSASFRRVGVDIRRLHICILSKEFPPFGAAGGIGTLYYHLASELLLLGHEVTVVLPSDATSRFDQGRFHIRYVQRGPVEFREEPPATAANLSWSLRAAAAVAEIHGERAVDIVDSALWDTEALALALIEQPRPPVVARLVTPFAVAAETNGWILQPEIAAQYVAAEKALIEHADAVVGISDSIIKTVATQYCMEPDRRWYVSHCGIAYWPFFNWHDDYDELTGEEKIGRFVARYPKTVLFVGRLERRKGIDTLIAAAADFLGKHKNVGLIVCGQDIEDWQTKAAKMVPAGVRSQILFTGNVSDATREKLMARAYCLVFPSRYESFGLVPLEAFVHGVPVIAAQAGAIPEVVADGTSGLLFPAQDASSLAQKVDALILDTALQERLSCGARRAIHEFSGRASAIRAIDLYASLLGDKATADRALESSDRRFSEKRDDKRAVEPNVVACAADSAP